MPFYPGTISQDDGLITVDAALNNPVVIEQRVADLVSKNLLVDTLFSDGGQPVQGGAVIYSKITEKHLYTENDVADRNPGDEYPVLYRLRPETELARVQDFGSTFATSHEGRTRNSVVDFDNDVSALANTITRKLNRRAIETIQTAVDTSEDVFQLQASAPWTTTMASGNPAEFTSPRDLPHSDIATILAHAARKDMGITYSVLLVSPEAHADLRITYGANLTAVLADYGLTITETNYLPAGDSYLVDPGKVGFVQYEEQLTIKTWEDQAHRQTWTQGYCMPVMGVTLPAAISVIRGITDKA